MTRRTIRKAAASVVGFLALLLALGAALAPWWINLAPVRARLEAAATAAIGGAARYERIDLSWLPRPAIVVRRLELSAPGAAQGTIRAVSVSPALLPLLGGHVRLSTAVADGPELTVELPGEKGDASADPLETLRSLVPEGEGLDVGLRGGRLRLVREGTTLVSLDGLDVKVAVTGKGRALHGEVTSSVRALSLRRGTRPELAIDGLRIEGRVDSVEGRTELLLSRLSAEAPRFSAGATLRVGGTTPRADLAVQGGEMDVTGIRARLLPFAGDVPVLASVFGILRGGTLPSFSFAVQGEAPADLGVFEKMSIRASLAGGRVVLEGLGLDFGAARGEVSIEGAVLSATSVAAGVGRAEVRDGSLLVGLGKGDGRLRVEAKVRADLAELPRLLSRALREGTVVQELSLVESLEGTASGRIAIDGRTGSLDVAVSVSEMRFSALYRRIPWPVRVDSGSFDFDGSHVSVSRVAGSVGGSRLSGLEARVRLGDDPFIEKASGTVESPLGELFSGIASREGMESLRTAVHRLGGTARVTVAALSGPFSRPGSWTIEAEGTLDDLLLEASFLPGPLVVRTGRFAIAPDAVRLTGLEARLLDAALRVSGSVRGWRDPARTFEATADGVVGPEGVLRAWQKWTLPPELLPKAPLALHGVRLGFAPGGELSLAGRFTAPRGSEAALDLVSGPMGIDVRELTVADGDSTASLSFRREGESTQLGFLGCLDGATLSRILERRPEARGRIEGDYRASLPGKGPGRATSDGQLFVTGVEVPTPAGPLTIERLALRGEEGRIAMTGSSFVLDGQRFEAAGSAGLRDGGVDLDLDVKAGDLAWPWIEGLAGRVAGPAPAEPPPSVVGTVRFSLDSFRAGDFTFRPVLFDVTAAGEDVVGTVRRAELCGISTTGSARISHGETATMEVEAAVEAAGPDIGVPLACLGIGGAGVTGRYEASLRARATGEPSRLLGSARGPLAFKASEGSLGKVSLLTRLLAVLNATDVFARKDGGRVGEAMPFRAFSVEGELGDGAVSIREGTLVTPSFTMAASGRVGVPDGSLDLMVLSQPLSTVGKVVQAIPVVNKVLGKEFLSVAAHVTGSVNDPKVGVSPAKDVGLGLVHILERTVRLPVSVFDPPPARN